MNQKILFLDIDGVLNSTQSCMYYHTKFGGNGYRMDSLDPIAISNLNYIIQNVPDFKIVISSTWRIGKTVEELKEILKKNGLNVSNIIDKTPQVHMSRYRGHEIGRWLEENDGNYDIIILDDDKDMGDYLDKLIQTDHRIGFSWIEVEKILKRWK